MTLIRFLKHIHHPVCQIGIVLDQRKQKQYLVENFYIMFYRCVQIILFPTKEKKTVLDSPGKERDLTKLTVLIT